MSRGRRGWSFDPGQLVFSESGYDLLVGFSEENPCVYETAVVVSRGRKSCSPNPSLYGVAFKQRVDEGGRFDLFNDRACGDQWGDRSLNPIHLKPHSSCDTGGDLNLLSLVQRIRPPGTCTGPSSVGVVVNPGVGYENSASPYSGLFNQRLHFKRWCGRSGGRCLGCGRCLSRGRSGGRWGRGSSRCCGC